MLGKPCLRFETVGVALGARWAMPPKFLAYLVVLCFDRRCPKQYTLIARLKSKYLAPPKIFGWLRCCLKRANAFRELTVQLMSKQTSQLQHRFHKSVTVKWSISIYSQCRCSRFHRVHQIMHILFFPYIKTSFTRNCMGVIGI